MGIGEFFELLKSFGHGLPFAFADLHFCDEGVDLDFVVDERNLSGRELFFNGVEFHLVGCSVCFWLVLNRFFFHCLKRFGAFYENLIFLNDLIRFRHLIAACLVRPQHLADCILGFFVILHQFSRGVDLDH